MQKYYVQFLFLFSFLDKSLFNLFFPSGWEAKIILAFYVSKRWLSGLREDDVENVHLKGTEEGCKISKEFWSVFSYYQRSNVNTSFRN